MFKHMLFQILDSTVQIKVQNFPYVKEKGVLLLGASHSASISKKTCRFFLIIKINVGNHCF